MRPSRQRGFTLVELMVAVAIVAILSRIAYVSYTKQVIKGNRTDAEQTLMQIAQAEERFYATHDYYQSSTTSIGITTTANPTAQSPGLPAAAIYTMAITPAGINAVSYTITATPVSGKLNKNDGLLQLTSAGVKCWDKDNSGSCSSSENTWNQ